MDARFVLHGRTGANGSIIGSEVFFFPRRVPTCLMDTRVAPGLFGLKGNSHSHFRRFSLIIFVAHQNGGSENMDGENDSSSCLPQTCLILVGGRTEDR